MRINSISAQNRTNSGAREKSRISFEKYYSNINENTIKAYAYKANVDFGFKKGVLEANMKNLWSRLQKLRETFSDDEIIDVHTNLDENSELMTALVKPNNSSKHSKNFIDSFALDGKDFAEEIEKYAQRLTSILAGE